MPYTRFVSRVKTRKIEVRMGNFNRLSGGQCKTLLASIRHVVDGRVKTGRPMAYFTRRLANYTESDISELEDRVAEHEAARKSGKYAMPKEQPKRNWVGQVVTFHPLFGYVTNVIEEINIFNATEKNAKEEIRPHVKTHYKGQGYSANLRRI